MQNTIKTLQQSKLNNYPNWKDGVIPAFIQLVNWIKSFFTQDPNSFWKTTKQEDIAMIQSDLTTALQEGGLEQDNQDVSQPGYNL